MSEDVEQQGGEAQGGETPREVYYAEARSWDQDRLDSMARGKRTAWIVAGVAAGIAVLEGLALIAMLPLKSVVPYTLLVDRNTGFVQALDGVHPQTVKPDAALTQSLLAQYVIAREGFDIAGIAAQYRKVALWSAEGARSEYLAGIANGNPQSPINLYPRTTVVETHVESVSPMQDGTAMVRFSTERRDQNQISAPRQYWVAVLGYRFTGEPMSLEDRLVNPLGFQVVHYRRDQEAPPPAQDGAGAGAGSPSGASGIPGVVQPPVPGSAIQGGAMPGVLSPPPRYQGAPAPQPTRTPSQEDIL